MHCATVLCTVLPKCTSKQNRSGPLSRALAGAAKPAGRRPNPLLSVCPKVLLTSGNKTKELLQTRTQKQRECTTQSRMKICHRLYVGWGGSRSHPRGRWEPTGRHPNILLSIRVVPAGVSAMATGLTSRKKSEKRLQTRTKKPM